MHAKCIYLQMGLVLTSATIQLQVQHRGAMAWAPLIQPRKNVWNVANNVGRKQPVCVGPPQNQRNLANSEGDLQS